MTTALEPCTRTANWWHCPTWCQPDQCYGGGTFHGVTTTRVHAAVHYAAAAANPDYPSRLINLELVTLQVEDPDTGVQPTETVLRIGDRSITATPTLAAGLADALRNL